jgi:hypothetical protein
MSDDDKKAADGTADETNSLNRHSPDGRRFKVYSETASGFWQASAFDACLQRISGRAARGRTPRNAEISVIKTHLSPEFARTHDDRTLYAGTGSGGDRSSAIIRRMSAKRFLGMATSAI